MPNKKISEFPKVTKLENDDVFLVDHLNTTSTVSLGDLSKQLSTTISASYNVKLDPNGGLMLNSSGELKIAPAGATSSVLSVRPSEDGATDTWVKRTVVNGELRPCFKTLVGATQWARNNITGNYIIFVDEDTIEGIDGNYFETSDNTNRPVNCAILCWHWNSANMSAQYVKQSDVDNIFGSNSGMKAGIYVWPRVKNVKMDGGVWFGGDALSNRSRSSLAIIRGRYRRGNYPNYYYVQDRYVDEAPRAINYNVYFTKDISLDWNSQDINAKWGLQQNRVSNWTARLKNGSDTHGFVYIRNSGICIYQSKMDVRNLNFVNRTNVPDIAVTDIQESSIYLGNVTLTMLGKGFYNYGALRVVLSSNVHACGIPLYSRQNNTPMYPGYGLAIVGNEYRNTNTEEDATVVGRFVNIESGSVLRCVDYDPFRPNTSRIQGCTIVDGDFVMHDRFSILLYGGTQIEYYNSGFIANNFNLRPTVLDFNQSSYFSTRKDLGVYPFLFKKGITAWFSWGEQLRKWTLDGSTDSFRMKPTIPMLYSSTDVSKDSYFGVIDTTNQYFAPNWDTDALKASNFDTDAAYIPYYNPTSMPNVNTFFKFNENGTEYTVNYGQYSR